MKPRSSRVVLLVMASLGWLFAAIFGVLACALALDGPGRNLAWLIFASIVIGPLLAAIPVGLTLFAAFWEFGGVLSLKPLPPGKPTTDDHRDGNVNLRWVAFAILCGLELLALPLTALAATMDDDSLMFSLPLNMALVLAILLLGFPDRKHASIVLGAIHLIGIAVASMAAAVEIESVIISGLFLLVTGVWVASYGPRPAAARVFFALSTVGFILSAFLVIAIGDIGKREAEAPLFAAIVGYQILFAPLGIFVLYRTFSPRQLPRRSQFGLKHLLGGMAMVCVASAFSRLAYSVDDDIRIAIAVPLALLILGGITAAIGAGGWKGSDQTARVGKTKFA